MSVDDTILVESVRVHPKLYDKANAGFKNPGLKEASWKNVAESANASVTECQARWQTLRERYVKEKRMQELESRSGSAASKRPQWPYMGLMAFIAPHIRKRKSVDNFVPAPLTAPSPSPSPTMSCSTDDEVSQLSYLTSPDGIEFMLEEQAVDDVRSAPFTIIATCPTPSPVPTASSAAASVPYLGPTGRCKKAKKDETAEMFKETLSNLNKSMSMSAPAQEQIVDLTDPDVLISRNVESCLKGLTSSSLKLKYRRKFRDLIQDCEEEAAGVNVHV